MIGIDCPCDILQNNSIDFAVPIASRPWGSGEKGKIRCFFPVPEYQYTYIMAKEERLRSV